MVSSLPLLPNRYDTFRFRTIFRSGHANFSGIANRRACQDASERVSDLQLAIVMSGKAPIAVTSSSLDRETQGC
jgi:hypothetical protein